MELLIAYLIFCLTTAIMATLFILRPVISMVEVTQPLNPVVEYKLLTHVTFLCMSVIVAPLLFLSVIIPSFGDRFRKTLAESLELTK